MPHISKFQATRYAAEIDLDLVTAPPYDVIAPAERDRLDALHPNNFVHVSLVAPQPSDSDTDNRYTRAAQAWRSWLDSEVLVTEPGEHLFLYRSDFTAGGRRRATAGIIAALRLAELGTSGIFGHERTTPGPKADRLALMRTTEANLEPLWFFSSAALKGFAELVETMESEPPMGDVTDRSDVRHRLWRLADGDADQLTAEVSQTPLVVADGHHRYETAVTYRDERAAADGSGPWDSTLVLISDPAQFAPELLPIHRVVQGVRIGDLDTTPFDGGPEQLEAHVRDAGPGTIGVSDGTSCWTIASTGEIDTVWLAENILEPAGASVAYEHDIAEVERALVQDGSLAFIMPSTPVDLVAKKALDGVRMPPKTTLFWPKPVSGLVMRDLRRT